jgi:hypothetical protein
MGDPLLLKDLRAMTDHLNPELKLAIRIYNPNTLEWETVDVALMALTDADEILFLPEMVLT